jgi:hypothetical protein
MKEKTPPKFYSIGEWYGHDVTKLPSDSRRELARLSLSKKVKQLPCPFREGRQCNKAGGVCSVRQYSKDNADIHLGNLVTV